MDTKQYILDERAKGTQDAVIFENLRKMNVPELGTQQPSPKRGFLGSILPVAGAVAGGIAGGGVGAGAGGVGAFPGAIAGSAAGGALGETVQQALEERFGQRRGLNEGQIAAAGITQGAFEAVGGPLVKSAAGLVGFAGKTLRKPMVNFFSKLSGFADDVVEKALQRTPGVQQTLREGERGLKNIISSSVKRFHELSGIALEAAKANMRKLDAELSLGRRGQTASRNFILAEARDFISKTEKILRKDHNIGVNKDGTLVFNRISQPSRIIGGGEKGAVQESWTLLNNIQRDTSILNIDATLERMLALQRKTPVGTPTGPESRKVIGDMMNALRGFVRETYPQYADEIEKNFAQRIMISQGKEIIGETAHLSPAELSKLTKRMLQIFNTGNFAVREQVGEIGTRTGQDILGGVAGALMKQGDQFSIRAQNLTRRGIAEKVFEFIPRTVVKNYGRTGKITGDMLQRKGLQNLAKTLGISVEALLRDAVILSQNYESQ